MTRLNDIPDRPRLHSEQSTHTHHAHSHVARAKAPATRAAPETASQDRITDELPPRAEALTTAGAGLPVSGEEPALPPPIYTKGPHYFCPPGFEGTALDPLRLAEEFMKLPDEQRGNFFNALCQYNPSLGSALNSTLRDIRGAEVQKNWLTHMDTVQGSTFTAEGLPAWLVAALTPPSTPPPGAPAPATPTTTAPIYTKGPHYFCPPEFEGTAQDPLRLAEEFMKLPDELRGNYFNAICQYNPTLGSALNSTLRDIRGADVQKNWLSHMDTVQGSTFSAEGLPPWLLAAFS